MSGSKYSTKAEFLSGSLTRVILSSVATMANSTVLFLIYKHQHMRNQPNYLLANLAASDLLMALGYLQFSLVNWSTGFNPTRFQCLAMMYPLLVATYASLCSLVPLAYYRIKLVKAYSMSHGHMDLTEPWKMKSSLTTLWVVCIAGPAFCFINVDLNTHLEVCVLPLAVSKDYLVPFFLFIITICLIVASEYVKIVVAVIMGISVFSKRKTTTVSVKWKQYVEFDPHVTRVVLVIAGSFVSCWVPFLVAICYYLTPYNSMASADAHTFTHWVTILPLVHSTIDPFLYSLSEKDFLSFLWSFFGRIRPKCTRKKPVGMQTQTLPHQPEPLANSGNGLRNGIKQLFGKQRSVRPPAAPAPSTISATVSMYESPFPSCAITDTMPTSLSNSTQLTSFSFPNDGFEWEDEVML